MGATAGWRSGQRAWERLGVRDDERVARPGSRGREPDPLDALGDLGEIRRLLDEVGLRAVRSAVERRGVRPALRDEARRTAAAATIAAQGPPSS